MYFQPTYEDGGFRCGLKLHSTDNIGHEALTWFFTYERFIHAEVMTHRWSRNYSSSRAIPYKVMMDWISQFPAMHLHWGLNQSGMQSSSATVGDVSSLKEKVDRQFRRTRRWCDGIVARWNPHKEIINRYTEPWGWITGMATMGRAQFFNFINLRCTRFANPNIQRLAINMLRLYKSSIPQRLDYGEWHTPWFHDYIPYGELGSPGVSNALVWSTARSAWISYNSPDKVATWETAMKRHNDCVELKHVTPLEHQLLCGATGGLVPGFGSYRMMVPGESCSALDIDALLALYEGKDYLI